MLFLFFHKRLCGPLANSRFHHQPDLKHRPNSKLEAAYHRADKAIQQIVDMLATLGVLNLTFGYGKFPCSTAPTAATTGGT